MSSPNYPPKTCLLSGCDQPLVRRNESIAEWDRRKYCSLACRNKSRMKPITHGTASGANTHWRRGEKPCEPCRLASTKYNRELPSESVRRHKKARARAMRRLAVMFPREYGKLVARELRRDIEACVERHPAGNKLKEAS